MNKVQDYTLIYSEKDSKLHVGSCREEKEQLQDVVVGDVADIEGYRGDGMTLTLTGLEFETTADIALVVPGGTKLVLESGKNSITVDAVGPEANTAAFYSCGDLTIAGSDGSLDIKVNSTEENCLWSRGICVRYGDLTITGGKLTVICGACSVHSGAVYAGGRLYGGDHQKGAISILGGSISASAYPHTIRATEGQLTVGAGSVVTNSNEFAGSDEEWHGSFIAQADPDQMITVSFR